MEPFPWLREYINRKTLALDMEAATFYLTLQEVSSLGIHSLVVKGVSDYADGSKNDAYHMYAERASAIYLLCFIREYVTSTTMPRRSSAPSSIRDGPPEVWNVPYFRNPDFTGRKELLDQLEQNLSPAVQGDSITTRRVALTQTQAIKGLGGIGKTQIAVEYAYRSRDLARYTHTLWINAASEETLLASFTALAELLPGFPAIDETDQHKLVKEIKRWLEQCEHHWLLIFDNADDVSIIQDYLPWRGNIAVTLDHFPLALDQAGAYLEETRCSFAQYLDLYQAHRKDLLAQRGLQTTNYPDAVATTWSLSFHKVEQANPAAAELLQMLAFLAPDLIPEELIQDGAACWSPVLQKAATDYFAFNQMIAELLRFSLVKRLSDNQALSIHRADPTGCATRCPATTSVKRKERSLMGR